MAIDTEKYRDKLIEERDRLAKQIKPVNEIAQPVTGDMEITAENAPAMSDGKDVETTVADMKSERLEKINAALQSIDEGTYGTCIKCGEQIDPKRLDAEPAAITCMNCLTAQEANFQSATL